METTWHDKVWIAAVSSVVAMLLAGDDFWTYFALAVPLSIGLIFAWELYLQDRNHNDGD